MDVLRGRWAPTPSGFLHAGNARSALLAWLSVRARGGEFLWRLEDLDPPRVLKGAAEQALDDLEWLGLDWDAGGGLPGPAAPYEQSARSEHYEAALQRLADLGRLFPCELSRKELRDIARAPHGPSGAAYPPHLRPKDLDPAWYRSFLATPGRDAGKPPAALRFLVDEGITRFNDGVYGPQAQDVAAAVGDFVLKRRDGLYAYQLAVVVDDLAMGVTEVVRGLDLLDSTARQIQLINALGGAAPDWIHVPLIVDAEGDKLSKRHGSLTLRSLRDAGVGAPQLAGYLAYSAGLLDAPRPCHPQGLVSDFSWARVTRDPWVLPADPVAVLLEIT